MGLPKGTTNNPAGRPKGSTNKAGAELRERITTFVEERWEQIQEDFEYLEPKERLQFFEKLLVYALPKLQNIKHEADENGFPISLQEHRIIIEDMTVPQEQ